MANVNATANDFTPFRAPEAAPTDPYRLRNAAGEFLAGEDGRPIELSADAVRAAFGGMTPDQVKALQDQVATLTAQTRTLQARAEADRLVAVSTQANAFADAAQRDNRVLPAARDGLVGLYLAAADDDHSRPVAQGQPTRVETFKQFVAGLPAHSLTASFAANNGTLPAGAAALPNSTGTTPGDRPDPNAVFEALVASPGGKAMLSSEHGRKAIEAMPGGVDWLARKGQAAAGSTLYPALAAMTANGTAGH